MPGLSLKDGLANFTNDGVDVAIRYGLGNYHPHIVERILAANPFPVCSPSLLKGPQRGSLVNLPE